MYNCVYIYICTSSSSREMAETSLPPLGSGSSPADLGHRTGMENPNLK